MGSKLNCWEGSQKHGQGVLLCILQVGEPGIGKTTFAQNLAASFGSEAQHATKSDLGPAGAAATTECKAHLVTLHDSASNTTFHYQLAVRMHPSCRATILLGSASSGFACAAACTRTCH
jgi:septin family protein